MVENAESLLTQKTSLLHFVARRARNSSVTPFPRKQSFSPGAVGAIASRVQVRRGSGSMSMTVGVVFNLELVRHREKQPVDFLGAPVLGYFLDKNIGLNDLSL